MRVAASRAIPRLGIWDILKNNRARRLLHHGNIAKLMAEIYRTHGSVVELKFPFGARKVVALLGQSTSNWFHTQGHNYLRSKDQVSGLESLFGASRSLPGMDGAEHFRLRQSLDRGYSRASLQAKLEQLFFHCRCSLQDWAPGQTMSGTRVCQVLMSRQVSHLALGLSTAECIEDLLDYQSRAMSVRGLRAFPEFMLRTRAMRRKRDRLMEVLGKIQAGHSEGLSTHGEPDLVDEYLRLHAEDPQFLPQTDLNFNFLTTMMASIVLGNSLAFAISTMTSHPEVYEQIKAEADALFGRGDPRAHDLAPEAMDTAHRLFLETQRLFPVVPVQVRHVMNPCIVEGHEIPVGTRILSAHTASHFLEEHFPDPSRFDIDRFQSQWEENMHSGVYAPFGLGAHKCPAYDLVNLQMVVNILLIAHHLELTSRPSNYDLRINPIPTNAPNKGFSIRVKEIRNRFRDS